MCLNCFNQLSFYLKKQFLNYLFKYNDAEFYVLYDEFEFSGCVVRTKDDHTMKLIEKIFIGAGIEWYIND